MITIARASWLLGVIVVALPLPAATSTPDQEDGEVLVLNPFEVTAEEDAGYVAATTLAGNRLRVGLKDIGSGLSVVNAQFLSDTSSAVPGVPVTLVCKADALVIQFALATTVDKHDARNRELSDHLDAIAKAAQEVPGLRFEPREVHLASGDRKRSIIGKGGAITSFAHFVIFAELSAEQRSFERIKQVRAIMDALKIDSDTTKIIDGPVGLFVRRPSQYREVILKKIFADLEMVRQGLGSESEIQVSGLAGGIRMRACGESEIELWIEYSFAIRSVREIEAKKEIVLATRDAR